MRLSDIRTLFREFEGEVVANASGRAAIGVRELRRSFQLVFDWRNEPCDESVSLVLLCHVCCEYVCNLSCMSDKRRTPK